MNKSIKISLNYFLGPILFVLLSYSLYNQITQQDNLHSSWQEIKKSWESPFFWLVFFLMSINWGLETIKWRVMMKPLENIPYYIALKGVLAGCSVTMLTPNRVGEYGGRILFVAKKNRIQAISVSILSGLSQLTITVLIGCMGMLFLKFTLNENQQLKIMTNNLMIGVSVTICIFLLVLFFYIRTFVKILKKWSIFDKTIKHISTVTLYSKKELLRILFLSLLRYMVFILQYVFILRVMHVLIDPLMCVGLISIFYLMLALAPTIGLIELPVRATAAGMILGMFSQNMLGIQAAVFLIWLINLVIPAILGSFFVFKNKV